VRIRLDGFGSLVSRRRSVVGRGEAESAKLGRVVLLSEEMVVHAHSLHRHRTTARKRCRSSACGYSTGDRTCEHAFVSIKGSSYANFRRALLTGNLNIIQAAAAELPQIALEDALRILVVMAKARDQRYELAAARWAGRVTTERRLGLEASRRVLALVEVLPDAPDAIEPVLRRVLDRNSAAGPLSQHEADDPSSRRHRHGGSSTGGR
jgi:hypothetical protein